MFPSDTDFDTKVSLETEAMPMDEELPFRILFLGDWSGRKNHGLNSKLASSRPIEIDRDNFDDVMRKLQVGLDLDFQGDGGNVLSLEFTELDDFHPDQIFQRLPFFANLRDVRKKLLNANTFDEAANEVHSWLIDTENIKTDETDAATVSPETKQISPDNLLDQILGETDEKISGFRQQTTEQSELSAFVSKLVKPHLIQTDAAEQSKLLLIVDEVTSDLMRNILYHPKFQALESAWRGAYFLVRRVETNADLKIYLLDISKDELTDNLKSVNDLTDSSLFQRIESGATGYSGDEPWSVVCGNYIFSLNIGDVASLIRLAKIADNINSPFISYIEPEMLGFKSFGSIRNSDSWKVSEDSRENKLWMTLRSLPEASYLGLVLPRFLARLPYGEQTEPTESFYFEEFSNSIQHEKYLWTNPAFACALLLAQTYSEYGWDISQNLILDIDNLPVHSYQANDEINTKPCAEIVMTESNFEQVSNQGLMPLISFQNSDRVRLGCFQSIADSFSTLKGRWY